MNKLKACFLFIIFAAVAVLGEPETVPDYDIDLRDYRPFGSRTKVALLEQKSKLKMKMDLPMLDGALALYPVYSAFARAVYPERDYGFYESKSAVRCTNTRTTYQNLIAGYADIIFVMPPSKEQIAMAKKANVTFRYTPIGKEAFVFFVNSQNPVSNLTVKQIQGIYSERIVNWREVGGKNERIRAFQRNENSGSQTAFVAFMKGLSIMAPPQDDVIHDMGSIIVRTSDYQNHGNAIGFSFRYFVNEMVGTRGIKILEVNGVYPEQKTITNGTYPISNELFAITLESNDKPNVHKLLEWIISEQGQYLVGKTGYSPITEFDKK